MQAGSSDGKRGAGATSARQALVARLDGLRRRRRELDGLLERRVRQPAPDATEVAGIRRRRLRVDDEIAHLERVLYPDQPA